MLMGHYSVAMAASGADRRLPLWASFLAVQIVDVAWGIFLLTGVEQIRLAPGLPSNSLVLEHMPYTHSLLGTLVFAGVAVVAFRLATDAGWRSAGVVGLAVASHWVLDLVVHRHDLTLFGATGAYGFGLWNTPVIASGLEVCLVVLGGWFFVRRAGRTSGPVLALTAVMVVATGWFYFGPRFTSVTATAVAALVTYAAMTTAAWAIERS